ncbi:MAG: hypothetical protein WA125_01790 [Desulfosporosinus sp.]
MNTLSLFPDYDPCNDGINLDTTHTSVLPSITYAVNVLIGLNLVLILMANIIIHKKDIDVLPPV